MSATTCPRHPGLPAVARCARCGSPYCDGCRVESLAAERAFCSVECRDLDAAVGRPLPAEDTDLAAGAERPIRIGWSLTLRSLPEVAAHLLPIALALAGVLWWGDGDISDAFDEDSALPEHLSLTGWILFGYGAALTAVLMTRAHTSFSPGNPYLWTLRRFAPWLLSWLLVGVIVISGMLLLIVPGIILGIRLFWADEYALVLESGPIASLRESWRLTRGRSWRIFGFQFLMGLLEYLILVPGVLAIVALHALVAESGVGDLAIVKLALSTAIFLIAFLTYSAIHASEIVYFYGLRAVQNRAVEP